MDAKSRTARCLVVAAAALALLPGVALAQSFARVRVAENARREPNGEILARVETGARLGVVARRGSWLQVDLEGWVWSRSVQASEQDGFDLVVSEPEGENLRAAPNGAMVARVASGMLLDELERQTGWIRVHRSVWIWSASVVETPASTTAGARPSAPPGASPPPAATPRSTAAPPGGFSAVGLAGAAILASPGGDTLARAKPPADLEILAREGNWARVRLEGWAWLPTPATSTGAAAASSATLTPADLARDPEGSRGRVVSWQLQFISLERAERIRTDFFEGEPFILARFGGPDGSFVYVAIPPDRISDVQGFLPLERLAVTGRVRAGASALTGTPIIDLITVERVR